MTRHTVASLAEFVGGELVGGGTDEITGVADLRLAGPGHIGFVREAKLADIARGSAASAVLVPELLDLELSQIVVGDPFAAFARIALLFHPLPRATEHRVHPAAVVHPEAVLASPVDIGPTAVVEAGARVGAGTTIGAGCSVGAGVSIGADCVLFPRVVLYPGARLGDRVVLHTGVVVGADGFGYAFDRTDQTWIKLPQVGGVMIGDDVEIGANSTVDGGTLGPTTIGRGCKIDNLCHIGHNCRLGEHCAIAGLTALSGSTVLGNRVHLAGHVVTSGHQKVVDGVRVGGNSVVHGDVTEAGDYMGYPLQAKRRWGRTLAALGQLADIRADWRRRRGSPDRDA